MSLLVSTSIEPALSICPRPSPIRSEQSQGQHHRRRTDLRRAQARVRLFWRSPAPDLNHDRCCILLPQIVLVRGRIKPDCRFEEKACIDPVVFIHGNGVGTLRLPLSLARLINYVATRR